VSISVFSSVFTSFTRNVRSAFGCMPDTSGESISGKPRTKPIKSVRSWPDGMVYMKSPGILATGASGLNLKLGVSVGGPIHCSQYEFMRRRSRLSVILPPYTTSLTMYCTVGHEMAPANRCFSRKPSPAPRSLLLYSYGMHQPSAPNLRRSCTTLCRKQKAYTSERHCALSTRSSFSWSSITVYDRSTPALRPAGGSLVTLNDWCKRPMGNFGCGSEVMYSLKSGLQFSWIFTSRASMLSIKPRPRWQFCNSTHEPFTIAVLIALSATGSCPSPMETHCTLCFLRLLSCSIESVGSAPADSR